MLSHKANAITSYRPNRLKWQFRFRPDQAEPLMCGEHMCLDETSFPTAQQCEH
uniref:Uncharacterized protein n=1 Tax=Anopheles quadriannulatus TaxID=34691 RepID=A0A182XQW2_ANOQN